MKQKEKDDLEIMYSYYGYRCFLHGLPANQRGHIISNTLLNRKLYGNDVIDSPLNWLPCHDLACNKACDLGRIESYQQKIADIIRSDMSDVEKRKEIENIVLARLNERALK